MIKICCIRFSKNNKSFFKGGVFLAVGMRGQSIMARKAWGWGSGEVAHTECANKKQ